MKATRAGLFAVKQLTSCFAAVGRAESLRPRRVLTFTQPMIVRACKCTALFHNVRVTLVCLLLLQYLRIRSECGIKNYYRKMSRILRDKKCSGCDLRLYYMRWHCRVVFFQASVYFLLPEKDIYIDVVYWFLFNTTTCCGCILQPA